MKFILVLALTNVPRINTVYPRTSRRWTFSKSCFRVHGPYQYYSSSDYAVLYTVDSWSGLDASPRLPDIDLSNLLSKAPEWERARRGRHAASRASRAEKEEKEAESNLIQGMGLSRFISQTIFNSLEIKSRRRVDLSICRTRICSGSFAIGNRDELTQKITWSAC